MSSAEVIETDTKIVNSHVNVCSALESYSSITYTPLISYGFTFTYNRLHKISVESLI